MAQAFRMAQGGVLASLGFQAGAVHCGLKSKAGAPDLAVLVSERPCTAAGVFTTNRIVGAPVKVDRERVPSARIRGIVVNSGNSNACTGEAGLRNARNMCALAAGKFGAAAKSFLVSSTGIIGQPLPMAKVRRGIRDATKATGSGLAHADAFARAIMTTDTFPKQSAVRLRLSGGLVTIGGAAKGSGMIAPNMATMLCFVTSDADVRVADLARMVKRAADRSFNCATVDGHTSTSDTLLVLANGAGGVRVRGAGRAAFEEALTHVCIDLAKQVVRDGEGATKVVTIELTGARTNAEAKRMAMAIANSPLVKNAVHGGDPNWGRIISAAGYAGVPFAERDVSLSISGVAAFRKGRPLPGRSKPLAAKMAEKNIRFDLTVGSGPGKATVWTCDLSRQYITINADYHT